MDKTENRQGKKSARDAKATMAEEVAELEPIEQNKTAAKSPNEDRLVMLSDGIFAIATTLLVLDIRLPNGLKYGDYMNALKGSFTRQTIIFAITFLVIYNYWVNHRTIMNTAKQIDRTFIMLTFLFLAFISFFPVASSLMSSYPQYGQSVVIYTLVFACCGFTSWVLWVWAIKQQQLSEKSLLKEVTTFRSFSLLISPTIFLLSLLLLLIPGFPPDYIFISWSLITFIHLFTRRLAQKRATEKGVPESYYRDSI